MNIKGENILKKTKDVAESQVTIPAHIEYPDVRFTIASGTIKKNDTVTLTVTVKNAGGQVKHTETEDVEFDVFPTIKEVTGVARLSFVEVEDVE